MSEFLFESDWLGSEPVYYNEVTGAASRNVNDVIELADLEWDREGLAAYLGTGFAAFQRTPVRGVRYLPPAARLWREDDGSLRVEHVPLDLDARLEARCSEDDAIELLRTRVRSAEAAVHGEIVIPTSGGYDSRLINLVVAQPDRVRSFSFGPSKRQWDSVEVARARALSELLGTRWERIAVNGFHRYLDDWDDAFGPIVHAHGMYQMDFYRQVRDRVGVDGLVFSGLFGDWFEGKGDEWAPAVDSPRGVRRLIYTFGMHVDLDAATYRGGGSLAEEYYERHRTVLRSHRRRIVEAVRFRMMHLHYLLRVPALYGFRVDAPFLDIDVATAMLRLPDDRRLRRRWIVDYLQSRDAMFLDAAGTKEYWLHWPAMREQPLRPLDDGLLAEVVRPDYVRWVNRTVGWRGLWHEQLERLSGRRGFRRAAGRLRAAGVRPRRLDAYFAYLTLRPIQRLLEKRDAVRAGLPTADVARSR